MQFENHMRLFTSEILKLIDYFKYFVFTQTNIFGLCAYDVLFILYIFNEIISLSWTFSVFKNIKSIIALLRKSDCLTASSICNIQNLLFFMVQLSMIQHQLLKSLKVIFSLQIFIVWGSSRNQSLTDRTSGLVVLIPQTFPLQPTVQMTSSIVC